MILGNLPLQIAMFFNKSDLIIIKKMNFSEPDSTGNANSPLKIEEPQRCFTCYFMSCECIDPKGCEAAKARAKANSSEQLQLFSKKPS